MISGSSNSASTGVSRHAAFPTDGLKTKGRRPSFTKISALVTGLPLFILTLLLVVLSADSALAFRRRPTPDKNLQYTRLNLFFAAGPACLIPDSPEGFSSAAPEGVGTLISILRAARKPGYSSLVVNPGSYVNALGAWSSHDQGKADFDLARLAQFDAMLPGPSELSLGVETLLQARNCGTPFVCANLADSMSQQSLFPPFLIFNFGKARVAVTGVIDNSSIQNLPQGCLGGALVADPAASVRKVLYQLRDSGVLLTLVLVHGNLHAIRRISSELKGQVNYLITGISDLQSEAPVLDSGVPILCCDLSGRVGLVGLTLRQGRPLQISQRFIPLDPEMDSDFLKDPPNSGRKILDQAVMRILTLHWAKFRSFLGETLAHVYLRKDRDEDSTAQSPSSRVVSEAMIQGSRSDAAAWPSELLKGYFWKGDFSHHDLVKIMPVDRRIWLMRVRGDVLEETLFRSCERRRRGSSYLYFGGVEFTTTGAEIHNPKVKGLPLNRTGWYQMALTEPGIEELSAYPELFASERIMIMDSSLRGFVTHFLRNRGEL